MQTSSKTQVTTLTSATLMERLADLERAHGMTSAEFYDRFRAGELGDAPAFMEWAGYCYMAARRGLLNAQRERA